MRFELDFVRAVGALRVRGWVCVVCVRVGLACAGPPCRAACRVRGWACCALCTCLLRSLSVVECRLSPVPAVRVLVPCAVCYGSAGAVCPRSDSGGHTLTRM
eukprot:771868-Prymnesium_polylepis.1